DSSQALDCARRLHQEYFSSWCHPEIRFIQLCDISLPLHHLCCFDFDGRRKTAVRYISFLPRNTISYFLFSSFWGHQSWNN
ncbi:hypothetical protein NDU88_005625, partial [Pleurodeles waltl]